MVTFEIIKESKHSKARAGILKTAHGDIRTPVFMPVGTQATVKALTPDMVKAAGADIILSNTYHLHLRPGADLIADLGGLHSFMAWDKPILTDSGGFQVFSLSKIRKIHENGITFKSHIDGSQHEFTPRRVIDIQRQLGSDIMMPLDICTPYPASRQQCEDDLDITSRWEIDAFDYWQNDPSYQALFAIVQGGMYPDLRQKSLDALLQRDFPGYAMGGVSVGEPLDDMHRIIADTIPSFPKEKPRYLMGVGYPHNLDFAIAQGVDMFDCVIPTRLARHGQVFVPDGKLTIKNQQYKNDATPIDSNCTCYTCRHFSRAYLRHLFISGEILASTLMSLHNIHALIHHVQKIRDRILEEE